MGTICLLSKKFMQKNHILEERQSEPVRCLSSLAFIQVLKCKKENEKWEHECTT